MNIFDEPPTLGTFMLYGLARAVLHPNILFEVPPLEALKAYFNIRKHSYTDLQKLVEDVFGVPRQQYLQLLNENSLPRELYRYPSRLLLYLIVRITKPTYVVETGVGGGYASAHILEAMRLNNHGHLYSIDYWRTYNPTYYALQPQLPCGGLVPQHLRDRWILSLGGSETELPKLLLKLGSIDIFIHDSLHTKECTLYEYESTWNYIKEGGLLISHDIWMPWITFLHARNRSYVAYQSYGLAIK